MQRMVSSTRLKRMPPQWSNPNHEEEHDDEDEDTTHAILIVDENEGEIENETPERMRTSRTKPQKAKTTI
jgi:hypothetical protein